MSALEQFAQMGNFNNLPVLSPADMAVFATGVDARESQFNIDND